jgi:hypothetical protein
MKSDMGSSGKRGAQGGRQYRQYDIFRMESLFGIAGITE